MGDPRAICINILRRRRVVTVKSRFLVTTCNKLAFHQVGHGKPAFITNIFYDFYAIKIFMHSNIRKLLFKKVLKK